MALFNNDLFKRWWKQGIDSTNSQNTLFVLMYHFISTHESLCLFFFILINIIKFIVDSLKKIRIYKACLKYLWKLNSFNY